MKFLILLIAFSSQVFAQSSLETRVMILENKVNTLELRNSSYEVFCFCLNAGNTSDSNYFLVRKQGNSETNIANFSNNTSTARLDCNEELLKHPSCPRF